MQMLYIEYMQQHDYEAGNIYCGVGTCSTMLFSYLLIYFRTMKMVHNWFHTRGFTHENLMFN